ncbi:MAG: DUF1801 domain-containing protein [Crocinitomicaceae bacterium]|tara:strand:- start:7197 stop:7649 length:453 start_codon:yes stop_codon:yes gene_type:complete
MTNIEVATYLKSIPQERQAAFNKLRDLILLNIPIEFSECMQYGMIGYVVPHSIYPNGYHVNPKLPLPFINIANQKNFISLYHMGIYAHPELLNWFIQEYPKYSKRKLDMGKSCIRFNKIDDIPFELIKDLIKKMSYKEWVNIYESQIKRK